jgi:predicted metalloprotease
MRWDESHESRDVIDRRGEGPGRGAVPLGPLLFLVSRLLRTRFGWVVLLVGAALYVVAQRGIGGFQPLGGQQTSGTQAETPQVHFVSFVLDDLQATWEKEFARQGATYRHAKLVLYTDSTNTGCGFGQAATGPFYCPADERVYLDLGFFDELSNRLGASGQFAQAYVIAHEIGHHVQKLLGISERMDSTGTSLQGPNGGSVRLELQADCFAGIWARTTEQRDLLEAGDIDSAVSAAAAVGDDRLQRAATGTVSPEKWTHGSSAERVRWFRRGLDSGTLAACDTFGASKL